MTQENLFNTLTDTQKGVLISAALVFKNTIKEIFGEEYGEDVFNNASDSILPELKYEILKNAITHKYSLFIVVAGINNNLPRNGRNSSWGYEKISSIKALRTYSKSKFGLKEAKDICDAIEQNVKTKVDVASVEDRTKLVNALTAAGLIIN